MAAVNVPVGTVYSSGAPIVAPGPPVCPSGPTFGGAFVVFLIIIAIILLIIIFMRSPFRQLSSTINAVEIYSSGQPGQCLRFQGGPTGGMTGTLIAVNCETGNPNQGQVPFSWRLYPISESKKQVNLLHPSGLCIGSSGTTLATCNTSGADVYTIIGPTGPVSGGPSGFRLSNDGGTTCLGTNPLTNFAPCASGNSDSVFWIVAQGIIPAPYISSIII